LSQKLLIIVLVVLAVIFVITLGMSACKGSGEPRPGRAGAVDRLKGLQGNRFLEIGDDASTTCGFVNAVTLTVTGSCAITLEKRAFFRRSTRVVFRRCLNPPTCQTIGAFPALFRVIVNPSEGPTQNDDIGGKGCYGTAIGREGGRITLIGNATISLRRPGCPPE
jgi:hypothetical protein